MGIKGNLGEFVCCFVTVKMQCETMESKAEGGDPRLREEEINPRQGMVNQVCKEWLIHEDCALAIRLQEQEFVSHYGKNRSERRLVRDDLQQAKHLQCEEAEEAERMYERIVQQQEEDDAEVARRLQEELEYEALVRQRSIEEADQELAKSLQEKEKLRMQRKKEQRQVEKAAMAINAHKGVAHTQRRDLASSYEDTLSRAMQTTSLPDDTDLDLTSKPGVTAEQLRCLQEEQDHQRSQAYRDSQMAIEAQDRELAKLLQEQERARARKARERARQKALQKQQTSEHGSSAEIAGSSQHFDVHVNPDSVAGYSSPGSSRPVRPSDLDLPRPLSRDLTQERSKSSSSGRSRISERSLSESAGSTLGNHTNIAMAIDPTYSRRVTQYHHQKEAEAESGGSTPMLPTPVSIPAGTLSNDPEYYDSEEDEPAPPYMPIQGQRRISSLDKKKKPSKDGCKQQ